MYKFFNANFTFIGTYKECQMLVRVYGGKIRTCRF